MKPSVPQVAGPSDREDVQGLVLTAYGHMPQAAFVLLRVTDARGAREWLARRASEVRSAARWRVETEGKPKTALNLALTWTGLRALGLPEVTLTSFPHEFVYGMAERSMILRDFGRSAPEKWEWGNDERPVDGLLALYATTESRLEALLEKQRAELGSGVEEITLETGNRPETLTEHFGFRDGVSQPPIGGLRERRAPSDDVVEAGAFVLGHRDEYGVLPPTPAVPETADPERMLPPFPDRPGYRDLGKNGTYLVFRKLEQHVAVFWNFMEKRAGGDPEAMIALASKFIGRWPSGESLVLSPDRDRGGGDRWPRNDFGYLEHDARGLRCPIGSHVRRLNPRDSLSQLPADEAHKSTMRHRIIRRGIPYGTPLVDALELKRGNPPRGLTDDGEPRGLHFLGVNASISSQFEMISEEWATNAAFQGLYNTQDPILGNDEGPGRAVIQAEPARRVLHDVPVFVSTRAGAYFFMPGLAALRFLAALKS